MTNKKHFNIKTSTILLILGFAISFFSCDNNQSKIPIVHVDFIVDLNMPDNSLLTIPGNYLYYTGGVNGILIYHYSTDEYQAYERTCPHDPDCGKVYVDEANFNAVDTVCCGSEFSLLLNGTVTQGPSLYPLKTYACFFDAGTNTLHIKN